MSARLECPACHSRAIGLFLESIDHYVDYFRCLHCHHIWNIPKHADGPVRHVTPFLPGGKE